MGSLECNQGVFLPYGVCGLIVHTVAIARVHASPRLTPTEALQHCSCKYSPRINPPRPAQNI